jgi:hypothetical protein
MLEGEIMSEVTPFSSARAQVESHLDFAGQLAILNLEYAAKALSNHLSTAKEFLRQPAELAILDYDRPGKWLVGFSCSAIDYWKTHSIDCFEYQYRISQVLTAYSAKEDSGK